MSLQSGQKAERNKYKKCPTFSAEGLNGNLPYMTIKSKLGSLKFLIDTGPTHSITNPGIRNPKWKVPCNVTNIKTLQHTIKI